MDDWLVVGKMCCSGSVACIWEVLDDPTTNLHGAQLWDVNDIPFICSQRLHRVDVHLKHIYKAFSVMAHNYLVPKVYTVLWLGYSSIISLWCHINYSVLLPSFTINLHFFFTFHVLLNLLYNVRYKFWLPSSLMLSYNWLSI